MGWDPERTTYRMVIFRHGQYTTHCALTLDLSKVIAAWYMVHGRKNYFEVVAVFIVARVICKVTTRNDLGHTYLLGLLFLLLFVLFVCLLLVLLLVVPFLTLSFFRFSFLCLTFTSTIFFLITSFFFPLFSTTTAATAVFIFYLVFGLPFSGVFLA